MEKSCRFVRSSDVPLGSGLLFAWRIGGFGQIARNEWGGSGRSRRFGRWNGWHWSCHVQHRETPVAGTILQ